MVFYYKPVEYNYRFAQVCVTLSSDHGAGNHYFVTDLHYLWCLDLDPSILCAMFYYGTDNSPILFPDITYWKLSRNYHICIQLDNDVDCLVWAQTNKTHPIFEEWCNSNGVVTFFNYLAFEKAYPLTAAYTTYGNISNTLFKRFKRMLVSKAESDGLSQRWEFQDDFDEIKFKEFMRVEMQSMFGHTASTKTPKLKPSVQDAQISRVLEKIQANMPQAEAYIQKYIYAIAILRKRVPEVHVNLPYSSVDTEQNLVVSTNQPVTTQTFSQMAEDIDNWIEGEPAGEGYYGRERPPLYSPTYAEINEEKIALLQRMVWFPRNFQLAEFFYMVYWNGISFYIPAGTKIQEKFSYQAMRDGWLVLNLIGQPTEYEQRYYLIVPLLGCVAYNNISEIFAPVNMNVQNKTINFTSRRLDVIEKYIRKSRRNIFSLEIMRCMDKQTYQAEARNCWEIMYETNMVNRFMAYVGTIASLATVAGRFTIVLPDNTFVEGMYI